VNNYDECVVILLLFLQGSSQSTTPLASLERRQEDVLKRLEQLQVVASQLTQRYNISVVDKSAATTLTSSPANTAASTTAANTHVHAGKSSLLVCSVKTSIYVPFMTLKTFLYDKSPRGMLLELCGIRHGGSRKTQRMCMLVG
jgi:hypothetical protein